MGNETLVGVSTQEQVDLTDIDPLSITGQALWIRYPYPGEDDYAPPQAEVVEKKTRNKESKRKDPTSETNSIIIKMIREGVEPYDILPHVPVSMSFGAMVSRLQELSLPLQPVKKNSSPWTKDEANIINKNYASHPDIRPLLPGRAHVSIYYKSKKMGFKLNDQNNWHPLNPKPKPKPKRSK